MVTSIFESIRRFAATPNNRIFLALLTGIGLLYCIGVPVMALAGLQVLDAVVPTAQFTPTRAPALTATASGTPEPKTVCGGPPAMFILLVGTDARSNSYYAGLGDSIRIVRVDFVNPQITYIAFLRDLYVEIPGLERYGITHGKINQAYLYGSPSYGYYPGTEQGAGLLTLTIEHNFGIQAEHYVVVNMQSFVRIVDAIGGIDINLPYSVDARTKGARDPSLYYAAGQQHLDGYRTLLLARLRPEGDFLRSETQNLILQAIAAKMLTSDSLALLPGLIAASITSIQTDLGEVEIAQLTCLAALLDAENVNGFNFPENLFKGTRVDDPVLGRPFVWQVDFNILRSYLEYFKNGTWPEAELTAP